MGVKILIFRRNKRLLHKIRDFLGRREQTTLGREFINDIALRRINPAYGLRRIARQHLVGRQIAAIHMEYRANGQSHHREAKRQHRKNAAKE